MNTPGPWTLKPGHDCIKVVSGTHRTICTVILDDVLSDYGVSQQYNAQLVANAPELLEVLKEVLETSVYWGEYNVPLGLVDKIRNTIQKAEGS